MYANKGCVPKARIHETVSNWTFSLISFVVHCSIEKRAAVPPGVKGWAYQGVACQLMSVAGLVSLQNENSRNFESPVTTCNLKLRVWYLFCDYIRHSTQCDKSEKKVFLLLNIL